MHVNFLVLFSKNAKKIGHYFYILCIFTNAVETPNKLDKHETEAAIQRCSWENVF